MFVAICTIVLMISTVDARNHRVTPAFAAGDRRAFLGGILGTVAVTVAAQDAKADKALTGQASVFTGDYEDPQHPGCLRQVKVVGAKLRGDGTRSPYPVVEVKGYDGKSGKSMCSDRPATSADLWSVDGVLRKKDEATIDFSPKGGPSDLKGVWDGDGIVFPDGNKWLKQPNGTPNRRPKDLSTLKS